MKKEKFNFKDLKGTLNREEMKKIKGGTGVECFACENDNPFDCYNTHCNIPPPLPEYCGVQNIGGSWYYCICWVDCV